MNKPRSILFIHQNMPGQFKHIMLDMLARGHRLAFISKKNETRVPGVMKLEYAPNRQPTEGIHPFLSGVEDKVINGDTVAHAIVHLRRNENFHPDLVVGHTGWGEMLHVKDVLPRVPALGYFELFYRETGYYAGFDPEFPAGAAYGASVKLLNTVNHSCLTSLDRGLTPTQWQLGSYPEFHRPKITVLHEGIDTDVVARRPDAKLVLADGRALTAQDEVVTYVVRNLEPLRGWPTFIRAVEKLQALRPNAHVVIIGGDGVSYGPALEDGRSYKEALLATVEIDHSRVHFLGRVPYPAFLDVLHISSAHVYLTYPFILSWSCLEAMAASCLVIGSRTGPVQEVIRDGENGILVDFFDHGALAAKIAEVLADPRAYDSLRVAGRRTVLEHYDLKSVTLPRMRALLNDMMA